MREIAKQPVIRAFAIAVLLAGVVLTTAGFAARLSPATSAPALPACGAKNCVVQTDIFDGWSVDIVSAANPERTLYTVSLRDGERGLWITVNGTDLDGRYARYTIKGTKIYFTRPWGTRYYHISVPCEYGLSDLYKTKEKKQ